MDLHCTWVHSSVCECEKECPQSISVPLEIQGACPNLPILSPCFSKYVTGRFSEPWKISCNQELGLKRNQLGDMELFWWYWPLFQEPCAGLHQGKRPSTAALTPEACWANGKPEKWKPGQWDCPGVAGRTRGFVFFCFQIHLQKLMLWKQGIWVSGHTAGHLLSLCTLPTREMNELDQEMVGFCSFSQGLGQESSQPPFLSCPCPSHKYTQSTSSCIQFCLLHAIPTPLGTLTLNLTRT